MNRRQFLAAAAAAGTFGASSLHAARAPRASTSPAATLPADLAWHDARALGLEGRAFDDTEHYFDRLPARARAVVRPEVWNLSRQTSGMAVNFEADSPAVYVRYTLTGATLAMSHMPASGVSGVDLYAKRPAGTWTWLAGTRPAERHVEAALAARIAPGRRAYRLYLPLYNGVESLAIGVPRGAALSPVAPRPRGAVLFYGTSITQGGCASRPGMAFVNILGRRLDRPMLNFGFSGNGKMEVEVARFLAELDPAVFVLDCLANMGAVPVVPRTQDVVRAIREKRPETPILILEERPWSDQALLPHREANHVERCAQLREAFDALIAAGVKNLHYRSGADLLGIDNESTVDGSHPNDLGMMRYADALEPDLRELID